MTRAVAKVVVESGIVDYNALGQLQRWGYALDLAPGIEVVVSASELAQKILDAVESEDAVEMRSTDLDIVSDYLHARKRGRLHVPSPDDKDKTVGISVDYCTTRMGDVVIPWTSEAIHDMLLDERTYLKVQGAGKIYFSDVRELFYDEHKAFVVCTVERSRKGK